MLHFLKNKISITIWYTFDIILSKNIIQSISFEIMWLSFQPPWPEWTDHRVNESKWVSQFTTEKKKAESLSDYHGELPWYMSVDKWQRLIDIDPGAVWKIVEENENFDLISANQHLLESKIVRLIISSIMCLEKVGRKNPINLKHIYPNSPPATSWKPWHHIYSAKGQPSQSEYNPLGIYYIRLFFLGKWRKIKVDDYFPFDKHGNILLPVSNNKYSMWLLILSKALMGIASLSWTEEEDVVDFSVIACLSGWIQYKLDCRSISIDNLWRVIKMNLLEKSEKNKNNKTCLSYDTITCTTNKNNYDCDNTSSRIVFGILAETVNEIRNISPCVEHLIYFCSAFKQPSDKIEDLPKWKKLRWISWALDNKVIDAIPGSNLRIVNIFSPLSESITTYFQNEHIETQSEIVNEKLTKIQENIFERTEGEQSEILFNEKKVFQDNLELTFAEIYPYLRQLEIYYIIQNYQNAVSTNKIETLIDKVEPEKKNPIEENGNKNKTISSKPKSKNIDSAKLQKIKDKDKDKKSVHSINIIDSENEPEPFSETLYCKNIYINISVVKEENIEYGYLVCEKYNWKSVSIGPWLVGVKTAGTKTCLLQLGPGVQVCTVFYSLPRKYNVTIFSETSFSLISQGKLIRSLSKYSKSFRQYGENMLKAFKDLLPQIANTSSHLQFIRSYMKTFYPPDYKELTTARQYKIAQDFDEMFEDVITSYIFETTMPMPLKVVLIDDLKGLFQNEELGDNYLKKLDKRTLRDIALIREKMEEKYNPDILPEDLDLKLQNEYYRKNNVPTLFVTSRVPSKVPLKKMLDRKPDYLQLYPFMNDHHLFMKHECFDGVAIVKPVQECFVIARLTLNIHSTKAVPCSIIAETVFPKAVLQVIDAEKCERMTLPFSLSVTYHLKRNKIGYTILLCGYASKEMIDEELHISWKITVIGIDYGNVLHWCDSVNPFYCQKKSHGSLDLAAKTISGFYIPSTERIIGRFIIGVSKSILATLNLSVSSKDVRIGLTITGKENEIIVKAEGKGSILIPVILLDKNFGVPFFEKPDICLFFGTIHLLGRWDLTNRELTFAKIVRRSSQKHIISLEAIISEDENLSDIFDKSEEDLSDEMLKEETIDIIESSINKMSSDTISASPSLPSFKSKSLSFCGYDSSHTDSISTCEKNSTYLYSIDHDSKLNNLSSSTPPNGSIPSQSENESKSKAVTTAPQSASGKSKTVTRSNNYFPESNESISTEENIRTESNLMVEEHPYGLFGIAPYWKVSFIVDQSDAEDSFIDNDFIKYKIIQNLIKEWRAEDPERLKKGHCLREEFLDINKQDFLNLQLDPDNISISDFSENENNEGFKEDFNGSQVFEITSHTYQTLLLSSSSGENSNTSSTLIQNTERAEIPLSKPEGSVEINVKNRSNSDRLAVQLSASRSSTSITSSQMGEAISIDKVLEKSQKKLENILAREDTSSSILSRVSELSHEFRDISCPPVPTLTEALIEKYSLPFTGKPTLKHISLVQEDNEIPSEEELKLICEKGKVSLSRVYKKMVAPILWRITKFKAPFCLKDLPIQAYSQMRYSKKLEETINYVRRETNLQMLEAQNQIRTIEPRRFRSLHPKSNLTFENFFS